LSLVAGSNDGSISETLSSSVGVVERGECAKEYMHTWEV
jgi:hypothetical protein